MCLSGSEALVFLRKTFIQSRICKSELLTIKKKMRLPQPFKITEIQKYPRAVVIALLIGFLLIFSTVIGHLYNRKEVIADKCEAEKQRLYEVIISERNERIRLYESLIFYKNEANSYKKAIR